MNGLASNVNQKLWSANPLHESVPGFFISNENSAHSELTDLRHSQLRGARGSLGFITNQK